MYPCCFLINKHLGSVQFKMCLNALYVTYSILSKWVELSGKNQKGQLFKSEKECIAFHRRHTMSHSLKITAHASDLSPWHSGCCMQGLRSKLDPLQTFSGLQDRRRTWYPLEPQVAEQALQPDQSSQRLLSTCICFRGPWHT